MPHIWQWRKGGSTNDERRNDVRDDERNVHLVNCRDSCGSFAGGCDREITEKIVSPAISIHSSIMAEKEAFDDPGRRWPGPVW